MKNIVISNYTWHPTEERTEIKYVYFNGTLNETVYYPREDWVQVVNSSGSFDFFYIIQNGKIIGMQDFNGKKFVILNDHKGSAYAVLDSSGNVLELTFYEPYGGIISGGQYTRFDYEGEEQDPTTGDSDFDARKVDTLLGAGMFIEPDSVIQDIYDPQTLNHYAFERNSPYSYKDENGHCFEPASAAFCAAIAIGLTGSAIVADVNTYLSYSDLVEENDESLNPELELDLIEKRDSTITGFVTGQVTEELATGTVAKIGGASAKSGFSFGAAIIGFTTSVSASLGVEKDIELVNSNNPSTNSNNIPTVSISNSEGRDVTNVKASERMQQKFKEAGLIVNKKS